MNTESPPLPALTLKPGELLVLREPAEVTTILGSCLSITMFSPRTGMAAICHAMLPDACSTADSQPDKPYKYVACAIPAMLRAFQKAGVLATELEVKMFGGANVIHRGEQRASHDIGRANIHTARRILAEHKLRIRASNVGGSRGRKIVFNSLDGHVWHKHLQP